MCAQVLSPTSKIGSFVFRRSSVWKSYAGSSWYLGDMTGNPIWAYSNRSPLTKSDGKKATDYYRKVAVLTSLSNVDVKSVSHRITGESSIHTSGLALYGSPNGSAYEGVSVYVPPWMTDKVVQDCMTELQGFAANILEDAGQAKSTMKTVVGLFNYIVKLYTIARKGQWRKLRRMLRGLGYRPSKKIANGWLMYYYGIRPMVSTIDALCATGGPRQKVISTKRKLRDGVDPLVFVDQPTYKRIRANGKAEVLAKCGMSVGLKQSDDLAYWSSLGLTSSYFTDAVVTAWALVPYSFVLDWILPVERFLRTRSWVSGVEYKAGYITKVLSCNATYVQTDVASGAGDAGLLPKGRVEAIQFQRIAYNSFTPPSGLSLRLSLTNLNLVNAAALLIQRR